MLLFVFLAFMISYALAFGVMIFLPQLASGWVAHLAVLGPAIAALIAVRREGNPPVGWLTRQLRSDRLRWWWLFVPVAMVLTTGRFAPDWIGFETLFLFGGAALLALPEEIGWRAYMTRRLLDSLSPLAVGVVVGVVWAAWHGPKLFSLPGLVPAAIAISLLLTYSYARLGLGLWFAVLVHASFNASIALIETLDDGSVALAAFNRSSLTLLVLAILLVLWRRDWFWGRPYSNSTMTSST